MLIRSLIYGVSGLVSSILSWLTQALLYLRPFPGLMSTASPPSTQLLRIHSQRSCLYFPILSSSALSSLPHLTVSYPPLLPILILPFFILTSALYGKLTPPPRLYPITEPGVIILPLCLNRNTSSTLLLHPEFSPPECFKLGD